MTNQQRRDAKTVVSFYPGYGHLAPKTVAGRAFTAPYAILGIPICLVMLAGIGSKFNDIADALEKKIQVCKYVSPTIHKLMTAEYSF